MMTKMYASKCLIEQFQLHERRCRCRKLDKIVLNMGVGDAVGDSKTGQAWRSRRADGKIAGQKPLP